jgi:hypothetical protein
MIRNDDSFACNPVRCRDGLRADELAAALCAAPGAQAA